MTNRLNILTRLALLLTLVAGGACSHEDLPLPDVPQPTDRATLGITIGVDGATRAVTEDPAYGGYEPGSGYENYLDIARGNYRIYFFDTQNDPKYIGTFTPINKPVMNPSPEDIPEKDHENVLTYYYTFMGDVPRDLPTKFKLVVLANWEQYPSEATAEEGSGESSGLTLVKGETTLAQLCSSAESQFAALTSPGDGDWLGPDRLIPFYGVREYNLNQIVPDYIEDGKIKGDVLIDLRNNKYALPLLRAMARVEVILDNPYASFSEVKMTKVNARGYCTPENAFSHEDYTNYAPDGSYGYDWDKDFIRAVHLVGGQNDSNPVSLNFKKVTTDRHIDTETDLYVGKEKWVAYVPEYRNIGGTDFTTIEVTLADPDTDKPTGAPVWSNPKNYIYFATYGSEESNENNRQATATETGRYNIERNNVYRFTITDMSTTLECEVDIQPFAEQWLLVDYGLMRDEKGDLMFVFDDKDKLPDYFTKYMEKYPSKWPVDEITNETLVVEDGDYYVLVPEADKNITEWDVWLKDASGCKILTNYKSSCSEPLCATRKVTIFYDWGTESFEKDLHGEEVKQHHSDHTSIVVDGAGLLVYRNAKNDWRYPVESWDYKTHIFWYESSRVLSDDKKTITLTFTEMDEDGNPTGNKKTVTESNE